MKCSSTLLVILFLFGTFLRKETAAKKPGHEQRKRKLQTSRKDHGRYRLVRMDQGDVSTLFKVFSVNLNDSQEDLVDLNYETVWQNGSHTTTKIPLHDAAVLNVTTETEIDHVVEKAPIEDPENFSLTLSADMEKFFRPCPNPQLTKRRVKRLIFGRDGRIRLNTSTQAQKFPFSTTVKISTGCSGSLVSRTHVLTSAHCLHNGTRLLTAISNLKIGILRRNGKFRWIGVHSINFPERWRVENRSPSFDYAVVKLQKAVHKRPYLKLGVIKSTGHLYKLHFASFPGDKKANSLWYSHCYSRVTSNLLIGRCDAYEGSSGAGTYVRTSLKEPGKSRVVVGIVSGYGRVLLPDGRRKLFNLVTKLTTLKARQICRWIGQGSNCVSWTWNSEDLDHRHRSEWSEGKGLRNSNRSIRQKSQRKTV